MLAIALVCWVAALTIFTAIITGEHRGQGRLELIDRVAINLLLAQYAVRGS
jgi:hypothetical protein